ncbi:MAG TPA: gamma-butyrobetaine,2-oxoglutarate dioxygenase [Oceanospirillaceae bacterium]|jgi:gamma-butyrobetaine dioxygenase|nr:gamma-butyrobetaine,2-oxoglutarate dioxygenase [Oceanospirillaceae bacterium]
MGETHLATITLRAKGLSITTPEYKDVYFNYYWLRDNCPTSFHPEIQERTFDICQLQQAPCAQQAEVIDDKLVINWANEDHTSEFDFAWLLAWQAQPGREDAAALPRKHWFGDYYPKLFRATQADLENTLENRLNWIQAMLEHGIAIITGMRDNDQSITDLANLIGHVRPSVEGYYFDVKAKAKAEAYSLSFTAAALEMHTDTPAEENAPGIQFLHCRANDTTGGDNLFLDGAAVAEDFRKSNPKGFDILSGVSVPFYYDHTNFDWRSRQRVIETDHQGNVTGLTVSQHMADLFDLPQQQLDDYYPAFVEFMQLLRNERYLMRFRLNAGECVVFDNHRIIHGRDAYAANSGSRHLRGCYTDRGELRSRYRTLYKQLVS